MTPKSSEICNLIDFSKHPIDGNLHSSGFYTLDNISKAYISLNRPMDDLIAILISGTNGKGTCGGIICTILAKLGYSVAMYSSPHLLSVNERCFIPCNTGKNKITIAKLNQAHLEVKTIIDPKIYQKLTIFEIFTLASFVVIKNHLPDIVVVEVGLGGRLDATNVICPKASIITSISKDHCNLLGDRLELIAKEKAAIARPHSPLILGVNAYNCQELKQFFANLDHHPIVYVKTNDYIDLLQTTKKKDLIPKWLPGVTDISSVPIHIKDNFSLALTTITKIHRYLPPLNDDFSDQCARSTKSTEKTTDLNFTKIYSKTSTNLQFPSLIGRSMIATHNSHTLYLDVAHNSHALSHSLQHYYSTSYHQQHTSIRIGLLCLLQDKDIDQMLAIASKFLSKIILCQIDNNRRQLDLHLINYLDLDKNLKRNLDDRLNKNSTKESVLEIVPKFDHALKAFLFYLSKYNAKIGYIGGCFAIIADIIQLINPALKKSNS